MSAPAAESPPPGQLRALARAVARLGVDPELPAEEAKYVVLVNATAALGVLIVTAYLPLLVPFGEPARPFQILCLAQLPVWSLPLWLNARRRHLAAKNWLALGCLALFLGQVTLFGPVYGHQYFLLLLAVGPFLAFPPREAAWMWTWFAAGLLGYGAAAAWAEQIQPWFPMLPLPAQLVPFAAVPVKLGVFSALGALAFWSRRATLAAEEQVRRDRERSEKLLLNILPAPIAERLKRGEQPLADSFSEATVLFADIAGFTPLAGRLSPSELVALLNEAFSAFDAIAERYGLEKIKTIGDAYMVAGGLPEPRADHPQAVAGMALEMVEAVRALPAPAGTALSIRIGIHTGPLVAGVIGLKKFSYDLWGDTVNTASRMESHGEPGRIQVSEATRARLEPEFELSPRGEVAIKGKGPMTTWFLERRRAAPG